MSLKLLQFSYPASTRLVGVKQIPLQWAALDPSLGGDGFLRSWLQDDREEEGPTRRRIHWPAVCGLALAFAISAGFWAGVGLVLSRFG